MTLFIFQAEILTQGKGQCIQDTIELKLAIFTNLGFQNVAQTSFIGFFYFA